MNARERSFRATQRLEKESQSELEARRQKGFVRASSGIMDITQNDDGVLLIIIIMATTFISRLY